MTVEQLAQASGMSVRNIRNHQSRGLLPPPEVRARTGYYGQEHVDRLRLIQQMQSEGFNLGAIQRLIGEEGPGADRFSRIRQLITDPGAVETPEVLSAEELIERFGPLDRKRLGRALKLGVLVDLGDGRFEAPSPALLHAADELIARGVTLETALEVLSKVRRQSQNTARVFVELFLEEVWKPFEKEGRPEQRWARDLRVDRGPAPAGLGCGAGHLPPGAGGGDGGRLRQAAARAGEGQGQVRGETCRASLRT